MIHYYCLYSLKISSLNSDENIEEAILYLTEIERKQFHFFQLAISHLYFAFNAPIYPKLKDRVLFDSMRPL